MSWEKEKGALLRYVDFSVETLVEINDIELTALKIHLVVEDMLKFLLAARLGLDEEHFFEEGRVPFATISKFATAGFSSDLIGSMRALNDARNCLSHLIEGEAEFLQKLETFVVHIARANDAEHFWPADTAGRVQSLRWALQQAAEVIFPLAQDARRAHERSKRPIKADGPKKRRK